MLSWLLLLSLAVHAGAHVALAAGLWRRGEPGRAIAGLLLPPLAVHWGWRSGMRARVYAWAGALAVYAIGVAVA